MTTEDYQFFRECFTKTNDHLITIIKEHQDLKKDLSYISKAVDENSDDLKEHMRRTEANERRIEHVENTMIDLIRPKGIFVWIKKNYKFLIGISTLITIFISLLKIVISFIF